MLFFILFCYVFEVQLLLQIIINRIAIIVERRTMASKLKWATAIFISLVNIFVMCIVSLGSSHKSCAHVLIQNLSGFQRT